MVLVYSLALVGIALAIDADGDDYHVGVGFKDCNDGDEFISPKAQDVLGDHVDQDCDGHDALRRAFLVDRFVTTEWALTGSASIPGAGFYPWGDTLRIDLGGGTAGRTLAVPDTQGPVHVALDVVWSGVACELRVRAKDASGSPTAISRPIAASGTHALSFAGLPIPPRTLTYVEVSCPASGKVEIDWLSFQNAGSILLPPGGDISIEWEDVDVPGGGLHTSVVRTASNGLLIGGSDVGGVGLKDPMDPSNAPWRVVNGFGTDGLASQVDMRVWDVAGVDWDDDAAGLQEIYALTGWKIGTELPGGLWRSDDEGEHWELLADALADGVSFDGREDECDDKHYAGGRLLIPDEANEVLYLASNYEHRYYDLDGVDAAVRETGVYLWDEGTGEGLCPLPTVDLPTDRYIGALALAATDTFSRPVLVVGYRGPGASEDALYLCDIPARTLEPSIPALNCASSATVSCAPVTEAQGIDVRDIEVDAIDPSILYIADGGDDPEAPTCEGNPGHLFSMQLTETGWIWDGDIADPGWNTTGQGLTGISMDPLGQFLYAMIPVEYGNQYGLGTLYRIPWVDIGDPAAWQQIDQAGDGAQRRANTDYSNGWLEASVVAKALPEPEIYTPGFAIDATWFDAHDGAAHAAILTYYNMWDVVGLDGTSPTDPWRAFWDGELDTVWTFWPEPAVDRPDTYQTMSQPDAAADRFGNVWMPTGDHGLFMQPAPDPFSYPAEKDCLWELFGAGGKDVSIGIDDSVWVAMGHQGEGIPHNMGVFRTVDQGASWMYQGAAVLNANSRDVSNAVQCRDEDVLHVAQPMDGSAGGHAFAYDALSAYPTVPPTSPLLASYGNPTSIGALDKTVAVAVFQSYTATNSKSKTYVTPGRIAYTLDGGASWRDIPFDGDAVAGGAPECDAYAFFATPPDMSLVRPGAETYWNDRDQDGVVEQGEWAIELLIGSRTSLPNVCTLAQVRVDAISSSWDWITLDRSGTGFGGCRVDGTNFEGVAASPWSRQAFVWGSYNLLRTGSPYNEYGGACVVNLADESVHAIISPMNSDNAYELDFGEVIPHPQVDGTLLAVTRISRASATVCATSLIDGRPDICPTTAWPLLITGGGTTWNVRQLRDVPPSVVGNGGAWGDAADGTIYYVTGGAGTWRGTISW